MPNAKGNRSERKVRDQLLEQGWYVTKAGGSLGLWDLIALLPGLDGVTRVIQVKTNRKPGKQETAALEQFAQNFSGVQCRIAVVRDRKGIDWYSVSALLER